MKVFFLSPKFSKLDPLTLGGEIQDYLKLILQISVSYHLGFYQTSIIYTNLKCSKQWCLSPGLMCWRLKFKWKYLLVDCTLSTVLMCICLPVSHYLIFYLCINYKKRGLQSSNIFLTPIMYLLILFFFFCIPISQENVFLF